MLSIPKIAGYFIVYILIIFQRDATQSSLFIILQSSLYMFRASNTPITLVNTQNVSVTKIIDPSSIQRAETKYGLRIQFLAPVFMIHEVWLNA